MIPLSLITGFLGTGKTTFLKRLARHWQGRQIVYLVNEFSARDMDAALLAEDAEDVVAIPGGSVFCRCLVTEFIARLEEIPVRWPAVEGVVLEASGMANPLVIRDLLADTGLNRVYRLGRIVTLVEAGSFPKLYEMLPNVCAQVEAADVVLLNKADCYTEDELAQTEALVRRLRPSVNLQRCVQGQVALDLFCCDSERALHGDYARCRDPHYRSRLLEFHDEVKLERLQTFLQTHAVSIYRAKGYVPTAAGLRYIDFSASGFRDAPALAGQRPGVAVIFAGTAPPELDAEWPVYA